MADRKPRSERSGGKDEATGATAEVAMERFKMLARKLVRVSPDELRAERDKESARSNDKK